MIMNHDRYVTNLIGDANDVANKLPDRVFKTIDTGDQVCLCRDSIYKSCRFPSSLMTRLFYLSVDLLPEDLELAHLEQVGQVEQRLYLGLVQHLLHRTKVMIWPNHFNRYLPIGTS